MTTSAPGLFTGASLFGAAFLVLGIGCAPKAIPPETPVLTAADLPPAPPPAPLPAPTPIAISPTINVSDEIAKACALHFSDVTTAPKFDFDRSVLLTADTDALAQIATCVTSGPLAGRSLSLVGHADPRGGKEYNMALGDRRANSVADYLTGAGVERTTLGLSSRGAIDATGTNETTWQGDRRVDIDLR